MTDNRYLQEVYDEDLQILMERFRHFQADWQERSWHLQKYFQRMNMERQDVIEALRTVLADRLAGRCDPADTGADAREIYRQISDELEARVSADPHRLKPGGSETAQQGD